MNTMVTRRGDNSRRAARVAAVSFAAMLGISFCALAQDLLLVEMRWPTEHVKPWLELQTLDGESLGSIPTTLEDGNEPAGIGPIALSEHGLGVVLDGGVLRVFETVEAH